MTLRRLNLPSRVLIYSIAILSLAMFLVPATAQNVRYAQPNEDAGESATDDPADTGDEALTEYPQEGSDDDSTEVLSPAEQAEALERRAGEQDGEDPTGRAVILGMHVQEGDSGRVKVVDVAAASPAFDAGVREGDEIVSFDGFKAKSYREWIDGIRKLVTDTPDGEAVAIELVRGNKNITARIRTPEEKANDPRMPRLLGQQLPSDGQQVQTGVLPGANQPVGPGVISDNDVFINDGLFGDGALVGSDRAVAEISLLTTPQTVRPNQPNQVIQQGQPSSAAAGQPPRATSTPQTQTAAGNLQVAGAGRIGLAGFRDDQNGMVVMLDVGGLPPGSYPVGIEDPGLIMGGLRSPRSAQNVVTPPADQAPVQNRTNRINRPANTRPRGNRALDNRSRGLPAPPTQPTQPGRRPVDVDRNQSQSAPTSSDFIPPTVLAQVTDDNAGATGSATPPTGQVLEPATPPTGEVNPNLTPPTGEVNPNLTPPTGRVLSPGAPPTGQVLPPGAPPTGRVLPRGTTATGQPDPDAADDDQFGGNLIGGDIVDGTSIGGSMLSQIGVVMIDQSGTGRMQQLVEGARVRDVVGQAIVIYAPSTPPATTVPPNTNVSGTRGETAAVPGQQQAAAAQNTAQPRPLPGRPPQQVASTGPVAGTPTPVAAGIIRLMSDRRPNSNAAGATGNARQQTQPIQPQSTGGQTGGAANPAAQPSDNR